MRLSDGTTRERTPAEAEREFAHANRLGIEISDLKMQNDWLRAQLERGLWAIDDYREGCKKHAGTRRAVGAAA